MATLVNYNLSTFRDRPNPNKRRLQELQHSEARAHAARVAYWRKRKPSSPSSGRKKSPGEHARQDTASTASSTSLKELKLGLEYDHEARTPGQWTSVVFEDSSPIKEPNVRHGHRSRSLAARSDSSPKSNRTRPYSGSEEGSPGDGKDAKGWDYVADYFSMPRHPSSRLFDPLNSIPCKQGDEVVAAMDHCRHPPTLFERHLTNTTQICITGPRHRDRA